jgi:uncharacterized membrane protein
VDVVNVLRWAHLIAGAAWLGEVVVVVFVLVPVVVRADEANQRWMLATVFPMVFRLASVLIILVLTAGALLNLAMSNWSVDLDALTGTTGGRFILIGGLLGLALGVFHFVAERKLEPMAVGAIEGAEIEKLIDRLRYVPRLGLVVLVVVFSLMVLASG